MPKLATIASSTLQFLSMVCEDLGFESDPRDWIALDFRNGSVEFDCQKAESLPDVEIKRAVAVLSAIMENREVQVGVRIRPATRRRYAGIASAIDSDERVRFGLFLNGDPKPKQWHELTKSKAGDIEKHIPQSAKYFGEIQGRIHSFYKESKPPYLVLRELSTSALIQCYFKEEQYGDAVEVLGEKDAIVFVEGIITEDLADGSVDSIQVDDFRIAPEFSMELLEKFLGSKPGITGNLTTEQFVDEFRSDAEASS